MELDKTRIAIRERGYLDILDIALRVIRAHLFPIVLTAAVGIVPLAILNHWVINRTMAPDLIDAELGYEDLSLAWTFYVFMLAMLVMLEIPLATAPLTLYLGQVTFTRGLDVWRLTADFFKSLPQLLLMQVALRALMLPWVITWFLPFVLWPYLNEIILLERNPLVRRRSGAVATTVSRISALHSPNTGDLFARALSTAMLAPLLIFGLWSSLWSIHCLMTESWTVTTRAVTIYLQLAIWVTIALFAVVRFLSYLDLRIRNEGWELELRMRAEALRLSPQVAS